MSRVRSDAGSSNAQVAIELVRALTAEARCAALHADGEMVEAHLEGIVLEQTLCVLDSLPLTTLDRALLTAVQGRFGKLAKRIYASHQHAGRRVPRGDFPPQKATR